MNLNLQHRVLLTGVLLIAAAFHISQTANAQTIHEQLRDKAPGIISFLNQHELKTVGVLKFRVQKPGEKTTDTVGPLNSLLADRLEVALILANPFDAKQQINILKDASSQVSNLPGATHLTKEGRAVFFGPEFQLAWGNEKKSADAFLTGIVQVNDDRKSAKVGILYFGRNAKNLERIGEAFDVQLDASSVGEMGESFVLRGAFDDGQAELRPTDSSKVLEQRILTEASRVKSQLTAFPLQDKAAPVQLEVRYDGQLVGVEFRNGQAFVREPNQGQNVEFVLTRAEFVQGTLGVVLKVNGENTLYRQTFRDLDCSKWLLTPEHTRTLVRGYQTSDNSVAEKFIVLSERDSAKLAVDYGRNVGQIQLTVFKEQTVVKPSSNLSEEDEDLAALFRGVQPEELSVNVDVLKARIRSAARTGDQVRKGLIVAGDTTKNEIEIKKFEPDPTPVMSVTITYYTP